jgi:hypothetical protein
MPEEEKIKGDGGVFKNYFIETTVSNDQSCDRYSN